MSLAMIPLTIHVAILDRLAGRAGLEALATLAACGACVSAGKIAAHVGYLLSLLG